MGILDMFLGAKPAPRLMSRPTDFYIPALALNAAVNLYMWNSVPILREYLPLNWCEIYNPSTTTLTARVESAGGELFRIEAGSSRTLRVSFNNIIITNIGPNPLAANTAIMTLQRI